MLEDRSDRGEEARERPRVARRGMLRELLSFLMHEKKWWLIPLVLLLLGLVGLVVLLEGSALAPFVYPLF